MKRNQLTVSFVRSCREPGKYQDGAGLMLVVRPGGSGSGCSGSWFAGAGRTSDSGRLTG